MTARRFPVEVVLSVSSGVLLCDFSLMHEFIEFIAGHPVWTHELADKSFADRLAADCIAQYPKLEEMPVKFLSLCLERTPKDSVPTMIKEWVACCVVPIMGATLMMSPPEASA